MTSIATNRIASRPPSTPVSGTTASNVYNTAVNTAGKVAEHSVSLFAPVAEIVSGAAALFIGLVAEYVLKDSVLDKMSKVLGFLGLGAIGFGSWGVFKHIKKLTTPPEAVPTGIQPTNAALIKQREDALLALDPAFNGGYNGANTGAIFTGNQNEPTLAGAARELLDAYLSPEVVNVVNSHSSGPEPRITGVSASPLSTSNLRDRIAALLAFTEPTPHVVSSPEDGGLTLAAESVFLSNGDINPNFQRMVPEDFTYSYSLGKKFVDSYSADAAFNRINSAASLTVDSLKSLTSSYTEANAKTINQDLNQLQFTLDNLEALQKVINTVVSTNTADSKALRNISAVKQGLICAFNLQGVDGKDINGKLLEILRRNDNGVQARLTQVRNKFESLSSAMNDSKFPLQRKDAGSIALNEQIRDIRQSEFVVRIVAA